jgi:predicted DCC family thiol-disulfide oxidoreductase YuxK
VTKEDAVQTLFVLYDGACAFCVRCRDWLESEPQHVRLAMVDCRGREARRFARVPALGRELAVVDEEGRYWIGPAAFLMCLWALERWRWLALVALWPGARAIATLVLGWLSRNRGAVGELLGLGCDGHCGAHAAPAPGPYR